MDKKRKSQKVKLPPHWITRVSKSHPDFVYYFNTKSGCTTWTLPIIEPQFEINSTPVSSSECTSSELEDYDEDQDLNGFMLPRPCRLSSPVRKTPDLVKIEDEVVSSSTIDKMNQDVRSRLGPKTPAQARLESLRVNLKNNVEKQTTINSQSSGDRNVILETNIPSSSRLKRPLDSDNVEVRPFKKFFSENFNNGNMITLPRQNNENDIVKNPFGYANHLSDGDFTPPKLLPNFSPSPIPPHQQLKLPPCIIPKSSSTPVILNKTHLENSPINHSLQTKTMSESPLINRVNHIEHGRTQMRASSENSFICKSDHGECLSQTNTKAQQRLMALKESLKKSQKPSTVPCANGSIDSEEESMEWEDIPEETVVKTINHLRENITLSNNKDSFGKDNLQQMTFHGLQCKKDEIDKNAEWFLVFDTNIFISSLNFVKEMRDTNIKGLGRPTLCIPWIVIQELDKLKSFDKQKNTPNSQIGIKARMAVKFLEDNLKYHPNFRGQSYTEFVNTPDLGLDIADDEVLKFCLQLSKNQKNKVLILLTNDRVLRIKAHSSNVHTFSKDEFVKETKNKYSFERNMMTSSTSTVRQEMFTQEKILCSLKEILLKTLTAVVRSELIANFTNNWKDRVCRKPPWTLDDLFECLERHWIVVFRYSFSVGAKQEISTLKKFFMNDNSGHSMSVHEVDCVLESSLKLMNFLHSYKDMKETTLSDINLLKNELTNTPPQRLPSNKTANATVTRPSSPPLNFSPASSDHGQDNQKQVHIADKLKRLTTFFALLWHNLSHFCLGASELTGVPVEQSLPDSDKLTLDEVKPLMTPVLRNLENITKALKDALGVSIDTITEETPQIVNFYETINTIIVDLPFMSQLKQFDLTFTKVLAFYFQREHTRMVQTLESFTQFRDRLYLAAECLDQAET